MLISRSRDTHTACQRDRHAERHNALSKVTVHEVVGFANYVSYGADYSSGKQLTSVAEGHAKRASYC